MILRIIVTLIDICVTAVNGEWFCLITINHLLSNGSHWGLPALHPIRQFVPLIGFLDPSLGPLPIYSSKDDQGREHTAAERIYRAICRPTFAL